MRLPLILALLLLIAACQTPSVEEVEDQHHRHVGDIPANPKMDDPNFVACDESSAQVHYRFGNPNQYKGEKPAIVAAFDSLRTKSIKGADGYIIVRFLVNCKGQTGRLRVEQLDNSYQLKSFDKALVESIVNTTKELDAWIPAQRNGMPVDYYKYLTFKITDNQIQEVLP